MILSTTRLPPVKNNVRLDPQFSITIIIMPYNFYEQQRKEKKKIRKSINSRNHGDSFAGQKF